MKSLFIKLIIGILGCLMALYSIIAEFIPMLSPEKMELLQYKPISFFLPFLIIGKFPYDGRDALAYLESGNVVCLILNVLFLAGSILYLISKGKETRLIRFGYGVVFMSVSSNILFQLLYFSDKMSLTISLVKILYIIVAILVLKYIASGKQLVTTQGADGMEINVPAGIGKRFLHLVVDFALISCFFLIWLNVLQQKFSIESNIILLYLSIACVQLLYYILFEVIFAATPSKYLTETRVIENNWEYPLVGSLFKRSFCRVVPFERIAFAVGFRWYDTWSDTDVVEERKTGVGGKKYLVGIILFIVLISGSFYALSEYQDTKDKEISDSHHKELEQICRSNLQKRLNRLSTSSLIQLDNHKWYKVEQIVGDTVAVVNATELSTDGRARVGDSEEAYRGYCNTTYTSDSLIYFSRNKLIQSAISPENKVVKIGNYERSLHCISFIDEPTFNYWEMTCNIYGDSVLSCRANNEGWLMNLTNIENRIGKIEWDIEKMKDSNSERSAYFIGKITPEEAEYEVVFTNRTSLTEINYLLKIRVGNTNSDGYRRIYNYIEELE